MFKNTTQHKKNVIFHWISVISHIHKCLNKKKKKKGEITSLLSAESKICGEHCISKEATVEERPTSSNVSSRVIFSVVRPLSIRVCSSDELST